MIRTLVGVTEYAKDEHLHLRRLARPECNARSQWDKESETRSAAAPSSKGFGHEHPEVPPTRGSAAGLIVQQV